MALSEIVALMSAMGASTDILHASASKRRGDVKCLSG